VDVTATAGHWVLYRSSTGTTVRDRSYPVADGGPVPGLDADYHWLLAHLIEPPAIDSRFQEIAYPCPEAPDLTAGTWTTTCAATVRPPAQILGAVHAIASERIGAAIGTAGLSDPSDQYRAIGLLQRQVAGQTLSEDQAAWLASVGTTSIEYVDLVRRREAEINAWVADHPGQIPDVGAAVWPPLPSAGNP
jgi:hypothetical protein